MAGIYIHIPFCKSKCNYCDFFSEKPKSDDLINKYISAIINELKLQNSYLQNKNIKTIYFGGGTPSLLTTKQITQIFEAIQENYNLNKNFEFTFEANPDDLKINYLRDLKNNTQINRLSIGVQSFFDDDLKLMNRRHDSNQAISAIKNAQNIGFNNISADLIYGLPKTVQFKNSLKPAYSFNKNLKKLLSLNVQHISAYHLTYEEGTKFHDWLGTKKISEIDEEESINLFKTLISETQKNGFIHYEISNFAKPNFFSKHNFNYWKQKKYLGIGASAHSYNKNSRQWNIANISKYINSIEQNKIPAEIEILSEEAKFNEYIMTSLRVYTGIDTDYLQDNFNKKYFSSIHNKLNNKIKAGFLKRENNKIILSDRGKFIADAIIRDLFYL